MPDVYVGLGSNIERERNVRDGLGALRSRFGDMWRSSIYEVPAEGFVGDDFLNLVVGFRSGETVEAVAGALREIEEAHGRTRTGPKMSARTLDLDLLLFGDEVRTEQPPYLPRDDITRYAFVLGPLAEIAPELLHPVLGRRISDLWGDFGPKRTTIRNIERAAG